DPNDALMLHCAFKNAGVDSTIHFVSDGVEVIDYLRGKQLFEKVASATLPGLLLINLDMPRMSGFGVLGWLRKHPHLRPPQVIIFSSSERPEDAARARLLGADHYLVKPTEQDNFTSLIESIQAILFGEPSDSVVAF